MFISNVHHIIILTKFSTKFGKLWQCFIQRVGCPGISHPKPWFPLKIWWLYCILCITFPPQWHQIPYISSYLMILYETLYGIIIISQRTHLSACSGDCSTCTRIFRRKFQSICGCRWEGAVGGAWEGPMGGTWYCTFLCLFSCKRSWTCICTNTHRLITNLAGYYRLSLILIWALSFYKTPKKFEGAWG